MGKDPQGFRRALTLPGAVPVSSQREEFFVMLPMLAAQEEQVSSLLYTMILFGLPILAIAYMWWAGKRRARQMEASQAALAVGQDVATTSGLLGRLVSLDDEVAGIEVAPGVVLRFDRRAVMQRSELPMGGPTRVADDSAEEAN